ncbi:MAG: Gfo/Idh/MocA family oxidoreductase [Planctomycetia bacterium]|nr:Gfo/Idh/MocA family oxidoreductase [Planctomycetia bacterium]
METTPLRIGIVGYGMIGKVHAMAHKVLPWYAPGLARFGQITHVATGHRESALKAARQLGCEFATCDFRNITENPNIDIVHICTPNGEHVEPLISALEHNKHIYCDKPMCATLAEANRVRDLLLKKDANGKPLYTGTSQMTFHLRFFSAIMKAKQLLAEKQLGRILQYRVAYLHSSSSSPFSPWKWKHSSTGGASRDLASHLLDLIDALLGLPDYVLAEGITAWPRRVGANLTPLESLHADDPETWQPVESEDAVTILTRHCPKDAPRFFGVIEATKLATGHEDDMFLEINGHKGTLRFSLMNSHYLEFFGPEGKWQVSVSDDNPPEETPGVWRSLACGGRYSMPHSDFPSPKSQTGWIRAHIASLANFMHNVNEGLPGSPDLFQGYRVQSALDAVERSFRQASPTFIKVG